MSQQYEPVIGLEVHLELHLPQKMFCSCPAEFGGEPNTQVCPVCLGLPGSLPVVNREGVLATIRAGLSLGCEIATFTKFDRKNYYYPDIPKGYQISQYDLPLCRKGSLTIDVNGKSKVVGITRVHLEEDTGKLAHVDDRNESWVDLNRAGIALVEIVTEPDMHSAEEAVAYLKELKAILSYLNISDCNMEEGSLRCEPNISVRPVGTSTLGTKTEIKNLNSFKVVLQSVQHEIHRQSAALSRGEEVAQETRLWDEAGQKTVAMRGKETAQDYRYFPEPDIPPLEISKEEIETARASLPTPPKERRKALVEKGIPDYNAEIIVRSQGYADYFEACLSTYNEPHKVSNLLIGGFLQELNQRGISEEDIPIPPEHTATYCRLSEEGGIGKAARKQVLAALFDTGKDPESLVKELGVSQVEDQDEIGKMVDQVIAENEAIASQVRGGKTSAIMALVGQTMKLSKGRANPQIVQEILKKKLEG